MRRVFVPGFTQPPESWIPVWAHLSGDDVDQMVDVPDGLDFQKTAQTIGIASGRATYVGYSMGGRLSLQLALDRPGMVERLVLVSASPGIADDAERAARLASDDELAGELERDGVETFLRHWVTQPMFAGLTAPRAGLEERITANTVERLAHQLRVLGQGAQPSNWARLADLRVPVLLIVGERDEKYRAIADQMAATLSDARVETIAGAGHACHLEEPAAVAHLLTTW